MANGQLVEDQQILIFFFQPTTNKIIWEKFIGKFGLKIETYEGNDQHVYLTMLYNLSQRVGCTVNLWICNRNVLISRLSYFLNWAPRIFNITIISWNLMHFVSKNILCSCFGVSKMYQKWYCCYLYNTQYNYDIWMFDHKIFAVVILILPFYSNFYV